MAAPFEDTTAFWTLMELREPCTTRRTITWASKPLWSALSTAEFKSRFINLSSYHMKRLLLNDDLHFQRVPKKDLNKIIIVYCKYLI